MTNKISTSRGYCIIDETGIFFYDHNQPESSIPVVKSEEWATASDQKSLGKVAIFLSEDCNLRCIYCYANSGTTERVVSKENSKILIDFVCSFCDNLILDFHGGGEPLLYFDTIKEIYEYAYSTGKLLRTVLITNGYIVSRQAEIIDWITSHVDILAVSCDGTPEIQNAQRPHMSGCESAQSVERTITMLTERDYGFTVRSTVTGASVEYMLDIMEYFHSLGVENVIFSPCYNFGRSTDRDLLPNPQKYAENFMKAFDYAYRHDMSIRTNSFRMPGRAYCGALPAFNICLTVDNKISTCYEVINAADPASEVFIIGEVADGKVVLSKEQLTKLRNIKFDATNCDNCAFRLVCRGGCPVKMYRNSVGSSSNLCAITRLLVPQILDYIHSNPDAAPCILRNVEAIDLT